MNTNTSSMIARAPAPHAAAEIAELQAEIERLTQLLHADPRRPSEPEILALARKHRGNLESDTFSHFSQVGLLEFANALLATRAAEGAPTCEKCGDRGEVGGFINAESGYQTDPCPDCGEAAPVVVGDAKREAVMEAIAAALGEAYDCTRVWEAWSVGTMSQDDFRLIADDPGRVAEIADAAIAALALNAAPYAQHTSESTAPAPRFFVYSPYHGEFEECATDAERAEVHDRLIMDCLDGDEWSEGVGDIVSGVITHATTESVETVEHIGDSYRYDQASLAAQPASAADAPKPSPECDPADVCAGCRCVYGQSDRAPDAAKGESA